MKSVSKILILTLVLTLCVANTDNVCASEFEANWTDVSASDWMNCIPDDAPLVEINIPGTHNAACCYFYGVPYVYEGIKISTSLISYFGKTQSLSILKQLEAGTRMLDCRAAYDESICSDSLIVPHNMLVTADKRNNGSIMTVEKMVAYGKEFVAKHPTETVIVAIDRDGRTYDTNSNKFTEMEKKMYDSFRADAEVEVYEFGNESPRLGKVRGKVVVMNLDNLSSFGGNSAHEAKNKWPLVKDVLDKAPVQDYTITKPLKMDDDNMNEARPLQINTTSRGEINKDEIKIGLGIPFPEINAKVMNSYLKQYNFTAGKFYGWFFMDFVSESLNRNIFLANIIDETKTVIPRKETEDKTDERVWPSFDPISDDDNPEQDDPQDVDPEKELIQSIKSTTIGKVTLKANKRKITVSWKKGVGVTPSRYYVYRSTYKNKKFKKIKTITNGTKKYTDKKSLKKGKRYYYKVVGAKKVGDAYYKTKASAVKSIKCK